MSLRHGTCGEYVIRESVRKESVVYGSIRNLLSGRESIEYYILKLHGAYNRNDNN